MLMFNGMSAISVLWTILSLLLLFTCSLALFSPFWYEHIPNPMSTNNNESFVAFGLLRFCFQQQFVTLQEINEWGPGSKFCSFYDRIFYGIPSLFWKGSVCLYSLGVMLLSVTILLAHVACCRKFICGKSLFAIAGLIQLVAVVLLSVSLILFPFGLDSSFVKEHCGSSSQFFSSGRCQIAWGYVLAIASTVLLIFCPVLARHLSIITPRSKATVV